MTQSPERPPELLSAKERARFDAKVTKADGCWLWTAARGAGGYGVFKLRGRTRQAHRIALITATGCDPANRQAAHACGNVLCCNPAHLRWATHAENQQDKQIGLARSHVDGSHHLTDDGASNGIR